MPDESSMEMEEALLRAMLATHRGEAPAVVDRCRGELAEALSSLDDGEEVTKQKRMSPEAVGVGGSRLKGASRPLFGGEGE